MTTFGSITVFVDWHPEGYFLFSAKNDNGYEIEPDDLRFLLFAWDPESFYGTMIPSNEVGIEVSMVEALRFFIESTVMEHLDISYEERALQYSEMARLIRTCVDEGRFAPDEQRLGQGSIAWKLTFTEEDVINTSFLSNPIFTLWVDTILEEEILTHLERLKASQLKLRAKLRSSVGSGQQSMFGIGQLMQYDWKLAVGGSFLSEEEFQQLLMEKTELVKLRGKWMLLDPRLLKQLRKIVSQTQKNKGLSIRDVMEMHFTKRLARIGAENSEADSLSPIPLDVELTQPLQQLFAQLQQESSIPQITQPSTLHGVLRNYQINGASWLLFLRRYGLGGCLADDMGLGKTIQWITYLLHVKEQEHPTTPSLLICPTSVLGNWQKELERFAPSLRVYLHYGTKRIKGKEFLDAITGADLVLTTYALSHLDIEELTMLDWDAICLDEAQNIKNTYTKQSTAIRQLQGKHRVALTGTPIENRLTELWSIYDFINPGYLGTLHQFSRQYVTPIERTNEVKLITKVQKLTRPFLLRRMKKDPDLQLDLPEKNEMKNYITLTTEQAALYEQVIQDMFARIERSSAMERRGLILAALTKLKQLTNHPALYLKELGYTGWRERSNKLERLLDMVGEIRAEGERCLIFTQFVETGNLLKHVLEEERQESVLFLHGGVTKTKRDEMISIFQDTTTANRQDNNIFILSLKAGGIGLNLTAANHVLHFDRWWNPAVENQATDRAYRIGQMKNVQVYKFVSLGTLEERIDEMIDRKLSLSEQFISGGESWITELSTEELRDIFTLRREWIK